MIDKKLLLDSAGYVDYDGYIYAGSIICNSVVCVEKEKRTTELLYIDDTVPYDTAAFSKCARIGNTILFAPFYGKQLVLYDVSNKSVLTKELDFVEDKYADKAKFWEVVVYEQNFYVLGFGIPGIAVVNSSSGELLYIHDIYDCFLDMQDFYFMDGHVLVGRYLFLAVYIDSTLIKLDTETNKVEAIRISDKAFKPLSISDFQNEIWMTFYEKEAACCLVWNVETKECVEVAFPEMGKWLAPVFYEGWAYFFPVDLDSHLYRVSLDTHYTEVFDDLDRLFMNNSGDQPLRDKYTQMVHMNGSKLLFIRFPDWTWIEYDFQTGELTEKVYTINDGKYIDKYYEDLNSSAYNYIMKNNKYMNEKDVSLKVFISKMLEK